ncbi:MAG: aminoacyl-tRNA hydrolase [Acutalibacteraceae bacterium]
MNFFKRSQPSSRSPEFLIVGLGNPGKQYELTRHNAGFLCLDLLAQENGFKINKLKFNALIGDAVIASKRCLAVKPQTFMNNSGEAVRDIAAFYKIPPEKIIVIFDDISLPCGKLRIRRKGTDGGHNGIKSIIYQLQSDQFPRIKLGIGAKAHPDQPLADWVLSVMKDDDLRNLREAAEHACSALELMLNGETEKAMNLYNS